jgi:hypothetical protein
MRRNLLILSVTLIAVAAGTASAQQVTTGTIAVRVVDEQGAALPGATVEVSSGQGSRHGATGGDGRFLLAYLTPGAYSVRVTLDGFRPAEQAGVELRLGQRLELVITLAAGSFADALEVQGAAPVVDLSTATAGTALESEALARLPVGRRLGETLGLAVGASNGGGTGVSNPSISGGSGMENQYVVDGVSVGHPRYGTLGTYARGYGALGTGVTVDFIDEVSVNSAGTEAEYGQSTGGLVNVVTRSGSNDWLGNVFVYLRPEWLEGDREEVQLTSGAVNTTASRVEEAGVSLSGPLVRDRVFLFGALDPQRETTTFVAPEGFPLESLGETERTRETLAYAAKLTVNLATDHRLDVSLFGDPAEGEMGPQSADAMLYRSTSAFSSLEYGGHNQSLRYQGALGPKWLVEAAAGRAESDFYETPSVDEWQVTDYTTVPATVSGGKGLYDEASVGESLQYHLRSTHLLGAHEVRYGASYEDVTYDWASVYTGPPIVLADGRTTDSGALVNVVSDPTFGKIYRAVGARFLSLRTSTVESWAAFVQDRLELSRAVTVSAGLRYEEQKIAGRGGSFTFDDNWAPRLGVVVDPTAAGTMKVYASAGLFFARIPNSLPVIAFGAAGGRVLRADYYDAALTQPIPDGVLAGGTTSHLILSGTTPTKFDPDAKTTYIREASAGFEMQVGDHASLGVRGVYRDMPRILEDLGTASATLVVAKDPAVTGVNYFVANPRDGYPATVKDVGAFEDLTHQYQALELTFDRRFADNWSLLASYRWSRVWGNYEGFFRNDNGQGAPAQSSLYDFPTNDPSYTAIGVPQYGFRGDIRYLGELGEGPLPTDRPHLLKVYGTYAFDAGLSLGCGLTAGSGRPLTPMAANPATSRRGEIPEAPRGDGIESEDGHAERTPYEWSLDLHADYGFAVPGGRLVLAADVFNLFDLQRVVDYDQDTQLAYRVANPDYGRRTRYQEPRQVRLAVRYEF